MDRGLNMEKSKKGVLQFFLKFSIWYLRYCIVWVGG